MPIRPSSRRHAATWLIASSTALAACTGTAPPSTAPPPVATATPSASASAAPAPSAPPPAAPAAGLAFDPTFGDGGTFTFEPPKVENAQCGRLEDIELGADGSLYLLATIADADDKEAFGGCDSAVIKVTPAGKLDRAFGHGGFVRASKSYGVGKALAVAKDGSVLVATRYYADDARGKPNLSVDLHYAPFNPAMAQMAISLAAVSVVKLTAKGTRDQAFGEKGEARLVDTKAGLSPVRIHAEPDGSVTVVGLRQRPKLLDTGFVVLDQSQLFVARLGAKGVRDKATGTGFVVTSPVKDEVVREIVGATADGGTLVAAGANGPERLVKLTAKLEIDSAYGDKGRAAFAHPEDAAFQFAIAPSGAAFVSVTAEGKATLAGFLPNGKVDPAFGEAGSIRVPAVESSPGLSLVATGGGGVLGLAYPNDRDPLQAVLVEAGGRAGKNLAIAPLPKGRKGGDLAGRSRFDAAGRLLVSCASDSGVLTVSRYVLPR